MRGLYCDGRSIRLRTDLLKPQPQEGDIALRVRMAGICETDLQLAKGYMKFHGILGHEFVGTDDSGKRWTSEINASCHRCPSCLEGQSHHCPNRTVVGILGRDGAMADHVAVPTRNLHAIPDAVDDRQAVFIEPLAAAFRVTEQVDLGPGVKVAVLGDGKLGLLCAWVTKLSGATVTLVGKHESKLELAGDGIATILLRDVSQAGRGFDVVIDATGRGSGFALAVSLVRPCGTVVLKTTIAGEHTMSLAPLVIDEIRVLGSRCGPFPPAIKALETGAVDVRPLIGGEYALDDAEKAFAAAAEPGARKILIRVDS